MSKKLSWDEMRREYPDEWLLIVDYDVDNSGHIVAGVIERHSKVKKEVYSDLTENRSVAFRYTGESSFSGLRHHDCH